MDFAVFLGDDRINVFKKNEGIVLNEAMVVACEVTAGKEKGSQENAAEKMKKEVFKITAVGNDVRKIKGSQAEAVILKKPIENGRVVLASYAARLFKTVFKKVNGGVARSVLVCIPCSLTLQELADFKSAVFCSCVSDVAFVPGVICNAVGCGYVTDGSEAVLSVVIEEGGVEIAVVKGCEILAGGTVDAGGTHATRALSEFVHRKYNTDVSDSVLKEVRCEIGTLLLNDEAEYKVLGVDADTDEPKEVIVRGEDCRKVLQPLYDKISAAALQILGDVDVETGNEVRQNGAFIGGSGSVLVGLREFLTAGLSMPAKMSADSRNTVILGAGKLLNDDELIRKIIKVN